MRATACGGAVGVAGRAKTRSATGLLRFTHPRMSEKFHAVTRSNLPTSGCTSSLHKLQPGMALFEPDLASPAFIRVEKLSDATCLEMGSECPVTSYQGDTCVATSEW